MYVNYVPIKLIPLKSNIHNRIYGIRPSVLLVNKRKERDNFKYMNIHTFAGLGIKGHLIKILE